ncbi:SH3-like domain-containing protein [Paraburkholderia lacunae]|uniref:SH3-like domain-containing protein n=1 Tax=Paraburkholderia lacunae TaxID=2211104 RepID=UPI0026870421
MPVLTKDMVDALVRTGASARSHEAVPPRFGVGQQVRAKNLNPTTHTRLARYVRGKVGTIDRDHGVFALPDTMAHGGGECPQHVYSVTFRAQELWGLHASAVDTVCIDMWDDYLEAV